MTGGESAGDVHLKTLTVVSIAAGFLIIPFHEFGHMLGFWMTGHAASMSYARAYLPPDELEPFLAVLCGPTLPIIMAVVSIFMVYRKKHLSVFYPLAVIGSFDRLIFYVRRILPSDEYALAGAMGWEAHTFQYIFMSAEMLILALIALSFFRYRIRFKQAALIVLIPIICFFIFGGAFGIFVVERFVFPEQFRIQFGWLLCLPAPVRRFRLCLGGSAMPGVLPPSQTLPSPRDHWRKLREGTSGRLYDPGSCRR